MRGTPKRIRCTSDPQRCVNLNKLKTNPTSAKFVELFVTEFVGEFVTEFAAQFVASELKNQELGKFLMRNALLFSADRVKARNAPFQ